MKVTVITVCYNALEDLKKTVASVLQQTFHDWEYIVVDGGSRDGTFTFLSSMEEQFKSRNIPFRWISEPDKGVYDAMNKGMLMAQGEYVNYQNAGDGFYTPDSLKNFFNHKLKEGVGVLFGDTFEEYDFGSGIARYEDYRRDNPYMPFCHQSCFVRADLMRKFRFDLSYRIVADHDLFFRMFKAGVVRQYIQEVVARYNGQYGLSANNPLTLRLEGLRVHRVNTRWYYGLSVLWTYLRYGWIAWFKRSMPRTFSHAWMKHKRNRYIS